MNAAALRMRALASVNAERDRQEQLVRDGRFRRTCAEPSMENGDRLAVLGEEYGEVCRALLHITTEGSRHDEPRELRQELVHLAAVATAWIESIDAVASVADVCSVGVSP